MLTTKEGAGAEFPVLLQTRGLAGGTWSTVATPATTTDAGGAYSFSVTQTTGSQYRVIWDGVCESAAVPVDASLRPNAGLARGRYTLPTSKSGVGGHPCRVTAPASTGARARASRHG